MAEIARPDVRRAQRLGAQPQRVPCATFVQAQAGSAVFLLAGAARRAGLGQRLTVDATSRSGRRTSSSGSATGRSTEDLRDWVNDG